MSQEATILLIEDEPEIRRLVKGALEGEGFRIFTADTCARGEIEAGTRKPDLIILDLGLPDGDGIDLIRVLRAETELLRSIRGRRERDRGPPCRRPGPGQGSAPAARAGDRTPGGLGA